MQPVTQLSEKRNKAYRKLMQHSTEQYATEYKRLRAKARRMIKEAKKSSWQDVCSKMGFKTKIGHIWNLIHKMSGAYKQINSSSVK